jgi:ABC-type uncharacterized transport system permease subunit
MSSGTARVPRGRLSLDALLLVIVPLLAIAVALLVGGVAVLTAGESPLVAYAEMFRGAFGTPTNLGATLTRSIPIILTGLGIGFAFRAGLFNIGAEGQMILGALATAITANALVGLPPVLLLPLAITAGCLLGALWALLAGFWEAHYGAPLVITTLLLNFVAALIASYLVSHPLRDVAGGGALAQTAMISAELRLPLIVPGTRLHLGVLTILVLPLAVAWFQRRTVLGYSMRLAGLNPKFAEYGGVPMRRLIVLTMFVSGGIAGLAGVIEVLGLQFRYTDNMVTAPGFAWSGLVAALLALMNPLATLATGFFLAALQVGAAGMQRNTAVPLQLVDVVQATIIALIAARLGLGAAIHRLIRRNPWKR